ncbi:protein tramtrack, alpha isoform isoform X2 [Phlebotomus papatasi]|uniref:protein tramtrack, alpha isoform isoform X2 n=1 Tax=Phlebotomus papatasi TaxID=29031 RepID=UPI0024846DA0|nr:protein tramtrack, alpha isoform isoform X2 [Phlebotomus papatasi]XP_055716543.1 protein tramtrack, alpha isoform isoform X2 [Phlebotomus papatasi]XP_055716544.1 protein tramtrack, alpha isoform isoform X2 [Phlebotomus papatasi]
MTSQRFCLRWNNHQTNLLSVFDQLLHAETFTDVTLAVEGQYLKAHKMVLSACSPYFQALFVNHPEKHPIVILKDVPFADMKSLLDFMYRGEVSVDQERLTAFLRVAESLRIKGLTEVNDERPLGPAHTPPPPQLHRIHPYLAQRKQQGMLLSNPLLGSALTMPKRKRGRPRKLSGSSNGAGNDYDDYESRDNLIQGSPELLEVKMGTDMYSNSGNEGSDDNPNREDADQDSNQEAMDTSESQQSKSASHPAASTSKEPSPRKDQDNSTSDDGNRESMAGYVVPKQESKDGKSIKIRVNPITQTTAMSLPNALQQLQHDSLNNNSPTLEGASSPQSHSSPATLAMTPPAETPATSSSVASATTTTASTTTTISTPTSGSTRQPVRRRIRRKANSAVDDPAEQLTEMSVRGLNLFRYASINEGVYQCTECAKDNIQKTFKNKYSFQRHAFLYHEGTQRKVFPCPVCGKEFSRPDKMKNHMKTTHECYMPKDCVYPLNFLVGAGIDNASIPKMEKIETAMPTTQ